MCSISTRWWFIKAGLRYCIVILFIALAFTAKAQVIQNGRYEILLAEDELSFEVASAGDNGVFLYRRFDGIDNNALNLIFLDTTFQEKWGGYLPVDKNFVESKAIFYDSSLYVLLRYRDFSKTDLQIAIIDTNGNYTRHVFRNFIPIQIISFQVTQEAAIIGGYFNRVPVVIYYSFKDRKSKIAPGLFNEVGELIQIRTYNDGAFDVLVSAKNYIRQQTITIRNYDVAGSLIKSISLQPDDNRNLIFGRSIKTYNDMQMVAGVYGNRTSEFSKGIFMASIDPVGNDLIRYYSYADLENFFKFMKAKREQRIKSRIARRKIKGRKLRFNYRFIVHEIVPYKDQYIMLGEAFYPKYIYTDRGYGGFFSPSLANFSRSTTIQNGRIFDGYYYTHAVVIGFDVNGKLLWDNSFEINDVKTFELEQFVKLDVRADHITLLYLFDHKIRSKIINNNEVIEGKSVDPIELKYKTDETKKGDTDNTKLEYWFNHNFYAAGVQTISSSEKGTRQKRKVFFLNKISHP